MCKTVGTLGQFERHPRPPNSMLYMKSMLDPTGLLSTSTLDRGGGRDISEAEIQANTIIGPMYDREWKWPFYSS